MVIVFFLKIKNDSNLIVGALVSICRFYLIGIYFYQEVEHTQPKQLEHQAHMSPIIEPAEHFSTQARNEEKSMRIEW